MKKFPDPLIVFILIMGSLFFLVRLFTYEPKPVDNSKLLEEVFETGKLDASLGIPPPTYDAFRMGEINKKIHGWIQRIFEIQGEIT